MENDELDETSHKRKLFFNCLMAQNISHGDKVHDLIFSYLEIFEILRFKIVTFFFFYKGIFLFDQNYGFFSRDFNF